MRCPFCTKSDTKVIETRESNDETTRRRRECLSCKKRFTTYERPDMGILRVVKKDGTRSVYDRNKVVGGMLKACEKRPIALEDIERAADEIETALRNKNSTDIPSRIIGSLVMKKLKKLDKVAYIRFASVYQEFHDITSFQEEVAKLTKKG